MAQNRHAFEDDTSAEAWNPTGGRGGDGTSAGWMTLWRSYVCPMDNAEVIQASWDWITNDNADPDGKWGDLVEWDTSKITKAEKLFSKNRNEAGGGSSNGNPKAATWNEDVTKWSMAKVVKFEYMFEGAEAFEGNGVALWDVSSATSLAHMFHGATAFNGDVKAWSTGNVVQMNGLFQDGSNFNADLSAWSTVKLTDMSAIFLGATVFNSDITKWAVNKVTNMKRSIESARAFDQDLREWNVALVAADGMAGTFSNTNALTLCSKGASLTVGSPKTKLPSSTPTRIGRRSGPPRGAQIATLANSSTQ